ncbi:MAG: imidazolonepropionase [Pseudomonadota bacterium]
MRCETQWTNARLATMTGGGLGIVDAGTVAARDGRIVYAGPADRGPRFDAHVTVDCCGRWITPGLIDCHTHIVHAGDRAHEFERRLEGASYEEIARAGGGIASTVRTTRAASEDQLVSGALVRVDALLAEGVTTIEVKSGYGLTLDDERKMLSAAGRIAQDRRVRIVRTFLGAHALPPEFAGDPESYIRLVGEVMLPSLAEAGLVDAVDAFCEGIGFTPAQTERIFAAAQRLGLPVKLHADQLSNLHGAALTARHGGLSADHLEHLDEAGVDAMAAAGTVAVLLPGAYYFCRETRQPPIAALRASQVAIAIATDCNPGTSPLTSLLLAMNMGATLFRLTVEECLLGVTRNAARALGLQEEIGTLEAGKACDLAIWDVDRLAELVYRMGANPLHTRIWSGQ